MPEPVTLAEIPIAEEIHTDVLVAGGGLAGVCAAIAAARNGAQVVLIHERPVLGGNSSSEIRVGPSGATQNGYHRDAREGGIIEELVLETRARSYGLRQVNGSHYPMWDVILAETVRAESNIRLLLDTRIMLIETEADDADGYDSRVAAVVAVQQGSEATFRIFPKTVIDATGDGFVAFQAGAPFRYGREARAEHGESWAPDEPDNVILGSTIMFAARDVGRPVPFTPPAWAHSFPDEVSLPFRNHDRFEQGYWWIEWGGRLDTIKDNDAIRLELQAAVFGVWDHIKNHCTVPGVRERAATWSLDWVGHTPGKRESRRFEGDHILTEHDVANGIDDVPFDVVAHGGWPIDLHAPDGIYSPEQPCTQPPLPDRFPIPLRALYSRTVSNLYLAGRDISQTHVAHGATRVMKTCAVIGQAAGTAAAVGVRHGLTPRSVVGDEEALTEVQQRLLRHGQYLPARRNADPSDLVRQPGVRFSATSDAALAIDIDATSPEAWEVWGINTFDAEILATHSRRHPGGEAVALDRTTAQSVVISSTQVDLIRLRLRNTAESARHVRLEVRQARHLRDLGPESGSDRTLATIDAEVQPGDSWVEFRPELPLRVEPDAPVALVLAPVADVAWLLTIQEPPGTQAARWDQELGYWRMIHGTFGFEVSPESRPYSAANVASGMTRPETGTNAWISDPHATLPQAVTMTWPEPVTISTVELTFDSQLSGWIWEGVFPLIARDYRVEACVNDVWQPVASVAGNYQRRRIHAFDPVTTSELRVTVDATNGGTTARIYEIRAYE